MVVWGFVVLWEFCSWLEVQWFCRGSVVLWGGGFVVMWGSVVL